MDLFDRSKDFLGLKAPDFTTNLSWLNSPPLKLSALLGKVVLIDFWTYSCINCQRTLPYLRHWWDKYQDHGLVIIGVHSPEFDFEKDRQTVAEALKKYQVSWPVVLDNQYQIWDLYQNHYWPAEYLLNKEGKIIYTHIGEGNYIDTELEIQRALKEAGYPIAEQTFKEQVKEEVKIGQTPELYLGFQKGVLGNSGGFRKDADFLYSPGDVFISAETNLFIEPDSVYLQGLWHSSLKYLEHARKTRALSDFILLSYRASKVYLVMESASNKTLPVYVMLDGQWLNKSNKGTDIEINSEGYSFTNIQFSTLYNLIDTHNFEVHTLQVFAKDTSLRFFAFTFGS